MTHNTTSTDLSKVAQSEPSLCIPWVHTNITEERIRGVFEAIGFGDIQRIDIVKKTDRNDREHLRVFVHFSAWHDNEAAQKARQMLLNQQDIKIVYDDPWFWKIWASKSTKPEDRASKPKKKRAAPFVDFSSS